jgi:hypothetical protein
VIRLGTVATIVEKSLEQSTAVDGCAHIHDRGIRPLIITHEIEPVSRGLRVAADKGSVDLKLLPNNRGVTSGPMRFIGFPQRDCTAPKPVEETEVVEALWKTKWSFGRHSHDSKCSLRLRENLSAGWEVLRLNR